MKISKEILKLEKRIKPLIDDHIQSLIIGFEYVDETKSWLVIPQYEGGGDGHASYIEEEGNSERVLEGEGKTLPAAIKDLNKRLDNIVANDIALYRWY